MAFRDHNQSAFCQIVRVLGNLPPKVPAVAIVRSIAVRDLMRCTKLGSKTARTTFRRRLNVERGPEA